MAEQFESVLAQRYYDAKFVDVPEDIQVVDTEGIDHILRVAHSSGAFLTGTETLDNEGIVAEHVIQNSTAQVEQYQKLRDRVQTSIQTSSRLRDMIESTPERVRVERVAKKVNLIIFRDAETGMSVTFVNADSETEARKQQELLVAS